MELVTSRANYQWAYKSQNTWVSLSQRIKKPSHDPIPFSLPTELQRLQNGVSVECKCMSWVQLQAA